MKRARNRFQPKIEHSDWFAWLGKKTLFLWSECHIREKSKDLKLRYIDWAKSSDSDEMQSIDILQVLEKFVLNGKYITIIRKPYSGRKWL